MNYIRKQYDTLKARIEEPRRFLQVLAGPRQVGKSTLVGQVLQDTSLPHSMEVADAVDPKTVIGYAECGRVRAPRCNSVESARESL